MDISVINFSSRENGNCKAVSSFIAEHYAEKYQTNVLIHSVDGSVFDPCGNCDYECLKPGLECPRLKETQKQLMDTLCCSDQIYFVVPNYCGYPCGNYFAFNERTVGYFGMDRSKKANYLAIPKKFILISNSQNNNFLNAMRQQTACEPEMLYLMTSKYQKRSIAGDILTAKAARADLRAFLETEAR